MGLHFGYKWLKKHFYDLGNTLTCGLRGTGKDTTFSGVTSLCKEYISNTNYKHKKSKFKKLDLPKLDTKNTYKDFISGDLKRYKYPYKDGIDIFLADCGVYFPSQYSSQLDKEYQYISVFSALSRHLGECNIHCNCQNPNRIWNKLREQCDLYLLCIKCISIGKLVIQKVRIYDKYESFEKRVKPFKMKKPLTMDKAAATQYAIYKDTFENQNGSIKNHLIIAFRKGKYDTRLFKTLLKKGKKD